MDWEPRCGHQGLVSTSLPGLILGKTRANAVSHYCWLLLTSWQEEGSRVDHVLTRGFKQVPPAPPGSRQQQQQAAAGTLQALLWSYDLCCVLCLQACPSFSVCVSSFQLLQIMLRAVCVCVSFDKFLTFKITDTCVFYGSEWETVIYTHCMLFGFAWYCLGLWSVSPPPRHPADCHKSLNCIYTVDLPSLELHCSRVNCNRKHKSTNQRPV